MKLKLINYIARGDCESWRWQALLEIVEGAPEHTVDSEEWDREMICAAAEAGVPISSTGSGVCPGQAFSHPPVVEQWSHYASPPDAMTSEKRPVITIEQTGGLDI